MAPGRHQYNIGTFEVFKRPPSYRYVLTAAAVVRSIQCALSMFSHGSISNSSSASFWIAIIKAAQEPNVPAADNRNFHEFPLCGI